MHMPLEYTLPSDSQWLNLKKKKKKKQEKIASLNLVQTSRFLMSQHPKTQRRPLIMSQLYLPSFFPTDISGLISF
jgi:hypothetical protein